MQVYVFILIFLLFQLLIQSVLSYNNINIYIESSRKNISDKFLLVTSILTLFSFAVLRDYSVGTDYKNYRWFVKNLEFYSFKDLSAMSEIFGLEKGFVYLSKLLQSIYNNEQFVLSVYYVILFLLLYKFIKNYSSHFTLSLFVFFTLTFYNQSFNILRQFIAVLIVINGLGYLKSQEFWKYSGIIVLASFFHSSAFIFWPFYFLFKNNLNYKRLSLIIVLASIVIRLFLFDYLTILITMTGYAKYATLSLYAYGAVGFGLVINIFIYFIYYLFYNSLKNVSEYANYWIIFMAMTVGFNIFEGNIFILNRITLYFSIFKIVSLIDFIKIFDKSRFKLIINLTFILILIAHYVYLLLNDSLYETIFYKFIGQ